MIILLRKSKNDKRKRNNTWNMSLNINVKFVTNHLVFGVTITKILRIKTKPCMVIFSVHRFRRSNYLWRLTIFSDISCKNGFFTPSLRVSCKEINAFAIVSLLRSILVMIKPCRTRNNANYISSEWHSISNQFMFLCWNSPSPYSNYDFTTFYKYIIISDINQRITWRYLCDTDSVTIR
jgi:hypothetical protein